MAHILVVDDEAAIRQLCAEQLEDAGHTVDTVGNGREASDRIGTLDAEYDLVITDLRMPEMSGKELLQDVRRQLEFRTPCIVLSGHDDMIQALGAVRDGAFSVLRKPFDREEFLDTVEQALKLREAFLEMRRLRSRVDDLTFRRNALAERNRELFKQARLDPLTRLPNRLQMETMLHAYRANADRYEAPFAVAFLDVDGFHEFNQEHGHLMGDGVLRTIARVVKEVCRAGDALFRWGGDEFVLVLTNQGLESARDALQRIVDRMASTATSLEKGGEVPLPTLSAGLTAIDANRPSSVHDLLREANAQMRRAKEEGGGCVRPAAEPETSPPESCFLPIVSASSEPLPVLPTLQVGKPQSIANLTGYPLSASIESSIDYVLADEALASGSAEVTEVSEAGSVPHLRVRNDLERPILFLEGEALKGAKQNRILNTTVLVGAGKSLQIPVSCVEQRRWSRGQGRFQPTRHHALPTLRYELKKSVRRSIARCAGHSSDQRQVWSTVRSENAAVGSNPATLDMNHKFGLHRRALARFRQRMPYVEGATGIAVAIGSRLVFLDLFDRASTLEKAWHRLLSGAVMQAIAVRPTDAEPSSPDEVDALWHRLQEASWTEAPPLGDGREFRCAASKQVEAVFVGAEDELLHCSATVAACGRELCSARSPPDT